MLGYESMGKKKITIRDIAKMANVSHMTVSRVLNKEAGVKEKTRQKVLEVVDRVKYRADQRARSLVSKKSNLLGLIVSDIRNQFMPNWQEESRTMLVSQAIL